MTADRNTILARFEPPEASRAEAAWVGGEVDAKLPLVRGKRILLVEDQQPIRASLRMLLEVDDHQVTEAGNGAEALKIFTVGEFDLVITDFKMPVMEGNELAGSLKLLDPSLPILMVTASERARGDVENPVDALLSKPSTMRELRCALGKLLSARLEPAQPSAVLV
jgi:two-component system, cell cycle response regulator CpdR